MGAPEARQLGGPEWALALSAAQTLPQQASVAADTPLAGTQPDAELSAARAARLAAQPFLAWLIGVARPGRYVHVGAGDCQSYFTLCRAARQAGLAAQGYAVDSWPDDASYGDLVGLHEAGFAGWSCLMRMGWRDAVAHFNDASIDLLCIETARPDEAREIFQAWLPRLSQAAIVVLIDPAAAHDGAPYAPHMQVSPIAGIQLVATGTQLPEALQARLREWRDPAAREALQRWFNGLGSRLVDAQALRQRVHALSQQIGLRDQRIIGLKNEQTALAAAQPATQTPPEPGTDSVVPRNSRLDEVETALDEAETALADERARLAALEARFSDILSSRSWRITRPLRAVMRRLREKLGRRSAAAGTVSDRQAAGAPGAAPAAPPADRNDYAEWVRRYDTFDDGPHAQAVNGQPAPGSAVPSAAPAAMQAAAAATDRFTIVQIPVSTAASTRGAMPGGIDPELRALAETIEACRTEWVVLADSHGRLGDKALQRLDAAVEANPQAVALYGDSDFVGPHGRHTPQFRCDWNPALFLAQDYWGPLRAFQRDALRQAVQEQLKTQAATAGTDTATHHSGATRARLSDLTLRIVEKARPQHIVHVRHVLFHRDEAALQADATGTCAARHREVVQDHLARAGITAQAEAGPHGVRVRYALPVEPPLATLIIPTRNAVELMRQCIGSILSKTTYANYEIIVVDNGSDDPAALAYFADITTDSRIRVLRDDSPFNYSALNNRAAALARGDILVLVNNDIEVISPDWLEEMVGHVLQPGVGAVGARLWYPNDTLQHGGVILGIRGVAAHAHGPLARNAGGYLGRAQLTQNFTAVTAACLAVRKSIYDAVGGLNERDLTVAFNDIDFCLRLAAGGLRNVWTPHAELYHHESVSRGTEDNPQKRARFAAEVHYMKVRWGAALLHDAAYNPNLTLEDSDFSLAWPPRH